MAYLGQAWRVACTLMTHDVATTISDETADAMEAHLEKVDKGMSSGQAVHCVVIARVPKNSADKKGEMLMMSRTMLNEDAHEEYELSNGVAIKTEGDAVAQSVEKAISHPLQKVAMGDYYAEASKLDGHHSSPAALNALERFATNVAQNLIGMDAMISVFGYGATVRAKIEVVIILSACRMTRSLLFYLRKTA